MIKIGLTGNIASGKSTVEAVVAQFGHKIADLDKVSHELLETVCREEVLRVFGTIERKELSKIVFNDKNELKKLENIIHPRLKEYILKFFEENKNEKMLFISGALIYEAGFDKLFDKIIFVDAQYNLRLQRLMKRNSFDEEEAIKRINAQNDNFKDKADFVIQNDGSLDDLKINTAKILAEITN